MVAHAHDEHNVTQKPSQIVSGDRRASVVQESGPDRSAERSAYATHVRPWLIPRLPPFIQGDRNRSCLSYRVSR